jgi:membrane protease YdiL (CAAX protease family)
VVDDNARLEAAFQRRRQALEAARSASSALVGRHPRGSSEIKGVPRTVPSSVAMGWAVAYAIFLLNAELLVTFVSPLFVFPFHGGLVVAVSVHLAWLARSPVQTAESRALSALLLAFVVAPLIRVISLTLPLAEIEPSYRYIFAGVPMAVGGLLVAHSLGLGRAQIGIAWRMPRLQVLAVLGSLALGMIEFTILRPAPMGALPFSAAGLLPALSVGVFTGVPEEVIFRGVLQTAARPIMRGGTALYAATVFAVLHIGYASFIDLAFVFGVGLFYGWIFERSRSIVGVSIGHGLANVVLFFVAPYVLPMLVGRPLF